MSRCAHGVRAARRGLAGLAAVLALASAPAAAQASPRPSVLVLQLDGEPLRPGLVDALRIQLRGVATVDPIARPMAGGSLAATVERAAALARSLGHRYAIWLGPTEARADGIELVLYVAGDVPGQALVEVVRLAGDTDNPAVDRALALKVREVLRAADAPAEARGLPGALAPQGREPPRVAARAIAALGAEHARGWADGGAQTGALLAVGVRLEPRASALIAELRATLALRTALEERAEPGRVEVAEGAAALSARLLVGRGGLGAGAFAGIALRRLDAEGVAAGGGTGDAVRWQPALQGGVVGRLGLGRGVDLEAAIGLELAGSRERFALGGEVVLDPGRVRLAGAISLVFSVP